MVFATSLSGGSSGLNDVVQQLNGNPVYSGGVPLSSQLSSDLSGTNIAVASLADYEANGIASNGLASSLLQASPQYDTIVVYAGGQFGVASRTGDQVAMITALNQNFSTTQSVSEAVAQSLPALRTKTVTSTGDGSSSLGAADDGGPGIVGVGSAILALAVVAAATKVFLGRYLKARAANRLSYDRVPPDLKRELERFREVVQLHQAGPDRALTAQLQSILTNVQELFRRMDRKATEGQKRMAQVEYQDTFEKLNKALGPDYFLDIAAHPNLWDRPEARMMEVRDAVMASDRQILTNIRQVNASQDLDFQVALESLTRSLNTVTAQDMMRKQEEA